MEFWNLFRDMLPELEHPFMLALDWIAVPLGLMYTYFAGRGKLYSWGVAFISSLILVPLSLKSGYVFDTLLHFFYALAAIWGFFSWRKAGGDSARTYGVLNFKLLMMWCVGLVALSYWLARSAEAFIGWADLPFLDALTTVFSVFATVLIIYRFRDAWLLFIFIDAAWVFMYARKSLWGLTLLYSLYTLFALYAYFQWKRKSEVYV
jgi:nicotinamide mononucleotide transporter